MTDTTPRTIHILATGLTLPALTEAGDAATGRILLQGETLTLTATDLEALKDRLGRTVFDLTPEQQVQRFGKQMFADGPGDADALIGADDSSIQYRRAMAAREHALKISDPADRALALAEGRSLYGPVDQQQPQAIAVYPASTGF